MRNFHQHGIDTPRPHQRQKSRSSARNVTTPADTKATSHLSVDPGQRLVLLPPLRLQALRARRRRRTPQATTPRHAPEAHRTAPALPPSHLQPCPDATLREPGTLLDHRPLPAAGAAAHPAHHRRDGAPPGEQPGGELHLLQLLRERDDSSTPSTAAP